MLAAIRRRPWLKGGLLALPSALWLLIFFVAPLVIIFIFSFFQRGPYGNIVYKWTLANYARFFDPLYLRIFARSFLLATGTTLICLLLGYPFSYYLVQRPRRVRQVLLLLVIIPFWTNFLVRTYAWRVLLSSEGPLNALFTLVFGRPIAVLFTPTAVLLGLIYGYLPLAILPLYAAIERIDFSLVEAAQDLYANEWRAFWAVVWPLSLPGVIAASILVFIPALGSFVIPDLLGGAKTVMIGNLIQSQFLVARDWPFGSALSFVLIVIVLMGVFIYFRAGGRTL